MNPAALVLWVLAAIIGYLVTGTVNGALIGLAWALAASLAATMHGALLLVWCIAFSVWLLV